MTISRIMVRLCPSWRINDWSYAEWCNAELSTSRSLARRWRKFSHSQASS